MSDDCHRTWTTGGDRLTLHQEELDEAARMCGLLPPKDKPRRPCMHEEMDRRHPEMRGRPRMLSCPCPRCSPQCSHLGRGP